MRYFALLSALLGLALPGVACAQGSRIAEFERVRVGFQPYNQAAGLVGRYKIGLWTPVYIRLRAGAEGLGIRPGESPYLQIETSDFEDVGTIYRMPVRMQPEEVATFVGYTKTGNGSGDIKVELHVGNRTLHPIPERDLAMDLHGHIYLCLGRRVTDLPTALLPKNEGKDLDDFQVQQLGRQKAALIEEDVDLLPAHWFGYDGVDLIFLSTDDRKFLTKLADQGHTEQLRALAQWVRRGGRLVIPVSRQTQETVFNVLKQGAWQPPIPVVPPKETAEKFAQPARLGSIEAWGNNVPLPAPGEKPPVVSQLESAKVAPGDWDVEARVGADGPPLIARVKYGMGQIIYVAFSLEDPVFGQWQGRHDFLRKFLATYAPRTGQDAPNQPNFMPRGRIGDAGDITGQLYNALDNFDVRVIPFGFVAVFIVLYVVVVGPLEFVLLKYVFGRLEWTWITFPTVVLGVSIVAYFGAYAIKGQDLKINKVDVIDFDLRTDIDGKRQPRSVGVHGHTWLMILSPRIQSYTVGIEPNPPFWGDAMPAKPQSADLVSWMARPDNGPGGMGRGGGQGFFRKPYYYGRGDPYDHQETVPNGLSAVPIPVWMAKAFSASWETSAQSPPVVADLTYHQSAVAGKELEVTGTLRSNLGIDLVDTWLFYADRCYPIAGGLPSGKKGQAAAVTLNIETKDGRQPRNEWHSDSAVAGPRPSTSQGLYDPGALVKQILFQEALDLNRVTGNHSQRRLDLSWRLYEKPLRAQKDSATREAILFARVRFQSGPAEELASNASQPMPTNLWLGALPALGGTRPTLAGSLNQDTFIRIILPLKPAGN